MCIFNARVEEVGGTKILAGLTRDGRQVVVYRNYVTVQFAARGKRDYKKLVRAERRLAAREAHAEPTPAMILPFPLQDGACADDVTLVDCSDCEHVFELLGTCYPRLEAPRARNKKKKAKGSKDRALQVHEVGSYNVSIAASLADLRRIDASVFVVAPNVDELLSRHYHHGFGFIVACFRESGKKHPLAYVHPAAADGSVFVPTRHHHGGGGEEADAHWDHEIFSVGTGPSGGPTPAEMAAQLEAEAKPGWIVSEGSGVVADILETLPPPARVAGGDLRRLEIHGVQANNDVVLTRA